MLIIQKISYYFTICLIFIIFDTIINYNVCFCFKSRLQMTTVLDGNYQRMEPYKEQDEKDYDVDEREETPQESGVMIHVVPEGNKARWNHIEDLDSFFTRMYHYHQKHGFTCMILQEILELAQFIFVVIFSTFIFHCVDYSILFKLVITS